MFRVAIKERFRIRRTAPAARLLAEMVAFLLRLKNPFDERVLVVDPLADELMSLSSRLGDERREIGFGLCIVTRDI